MSDPRLLATNGIVAGIELKGQVEAEKYVEGRPGMVSRGWADLCAQKTGPRDRQVLYGEQVRILDDDGTQAFIQARKDGYIGYVSSAALIDPVSPTHTVSTRATHLLTGPRVQAAEQCAVPFGARLRIVGGDGPFYETHDGYFVPRAHLRPLDAPFSDPATIAQLFFGAPYLWGGNTDQGIDCSGLVQAALVACGQPCPGDSYQQMTLGSDAEPPYERGDLLFWKGHVAMVVDPTTMIHANAHTMSVAYEAIENAISRIKAQDGGPVLAHRRV